LPPTKAQPCRCRARRGKLGKTAVTLSETAVGFSCFSDDCADRTFRDLRNHIERVTGRKSKVRFYEGLNAEERAKRELAEMMERVQHTPFPLGGLTSYGAQLDLCSQAFAHLSTTGVAQNTGTVGDDVPAMREKLTFGQQILSHNRDRGNRGNRRYQPLNGAAIRPQESEERRNGKEDSDKEDSADQALAAG
jgi:hypothetical protein